ncbi:MAG: helix-turn-helix domain-containing protein [Achromobacter sp.]|uniref:helix-turn-helix domain-containing protein n=1 Tax=Achromobacter sp. TaxID=134375 RepID=UPI003D087DE9
MNDPDALVQFWSTDTVPVTQRRKYWIDAVGQSIAKVEITIPDDAQFRAELRSREMGVLRISKTEASVGVTVRRTAANIATDSHERYFLVGSYRAMWSLGTRGRAERLQPEDLVLLSSRREYTLRLPEASEVFSISFSSSWISVWIANPEDHVGVRLDASMGWSRVLCAFVRQLCSEFADATVDMQGTLVDQLGALIGLAVEDAPDTTRSAARSVYERVRKVLLDRHVESSLTAADVAADLGISVRTLYRHTSGLRISIPRAIAEIRLETAKRMLASRVFRALSVAEIGRRCGYSDASHFVRQFRLFCGLTPGEFRRQT